MINNQPNQIKDFRPELVTDPMRRREIILDGAFLNITSAIRPEVIKEQEKLANVPLASEVVVENPLITEARRQLSQTEHLGYNDEELTIAA